MIISVILAICAATSNAGSNVLQRKANQREPEERSFSPKLIWDLLHQKIWLLGVLFIAGSFLFQAGALSTGELAEVQPLIVLELPLTLVFAKFVLGSRLGRYEWVTIALLTAGLGGLVAFLRPQGGSSNTSVLAWLIGGGAAGASILVLILFGRRAKAELRGGLLGAAAGIDFGLTAAFMMGMTGRLSHGFSAVFTSWQVYAMAAGGALGMFLVQNALQAGSLVAAQPGISLLDPFTSIAWGVIAFHERTAQGVFIPLAGIAAASMVLGAVLLCRSPVLQQAQDEYTRG
ncbi:MAG TPA: DMT family transporter [Acidimicrobiales bacterium]|nr:DMT family transporter [Acidimicrobiales bacterium]